MSEFIQFDDVTPIVFLPENLPFEDAREKLREGLQDQKAVLSGKTGRLQLGSRSIQLFDLRRFLKFFLDEFGFEITGLYTTPSVVHQFAERELKLKLFFPSAEPSVQTDVPVTADTSPPAPATSSDLVEEKNGRRTLSIRRTLRSGHSVRFDGDVVVYGDVNPGAQVEAAGDIVILGALKGMAHAGAAGDNKAFIFGFELQPTQLRIERKIAIAPQRDKLQSAAPEIATISEDRIVIDKYRTSFFR